MLVKLTEKKLLHPTKKSYNPTYKVVKTHCISISQSLGYIFHALGRIFQGLGYSSQTLGYTFMAEYGKFYSGG